MISSKFFKNRLLSLFLVGLLSFGLAPLPRKGSELSRSYLAPRGFSVQANDPVVQVTTLAASLLASGFPASELAGQLTGEPTDSVVRAIQAQINKLENEGILVSYVLRYKKYPELEDLKNNIYLEFIFTGPLYERHFRIDRWGIYEVKNRVSRFKNLAFAARDLIQILLSEFYYFLNQFKFLNKKGMALGGVESPERRAFLGAAGSFIGFVALSTLLPGCSKSGSSSGSGTAVVGTTGFPVILDFEKNFANGNATPLKDNATPDTTFTFLVRIDNADPNNAPRLFHLTAKTVSGADVVLNPFGPIQAGIQDTFRQVFPINALGVPQQITSRAYLVVEPSTQSGDDQYSSTIDRARFPANQFRRVRTGEQLVFTLRALEGVDPEHPRFATSGFDIFNEAVTPTPLTVQEPATLIRNQAGNPEPGSISGVEQNPLNISNANDGTIRISFNSDIESSVSLKPGSVFVSVFNNQTGQFLNSHFVELTNPSGLNQFDIPGTFIDFNDQNKIKPIPNGTPLRIQAVNSDIGLTPADPQPKSINNSFTLLRDVNPITLPQPQLISQNGNLVEIVNGTRLLKLRISGNSQVNDVLTPEFHFIRLKLFNAASQLNPNLPQFVEYTASLTIPTVIDQNGNTVPNSIQPNDYVIEIPESLLPTVTQSTLEAIEVFNVRRGYQTVSSGEISLSQSANQTSNVLTSADKILSTPTVNNVSVQNDVVSMRVLASGNQFDNRVTGHVLNFELVKSTGETESVEFFQKLPTRLEQVNGQAVEVPINDTANDFSIKLNQPDVLVFLQNGNVTLNSFTIKNVSDQVPSGDEVSVQVNQAVTKSQTSVTEIPALSSVSGAPHSLGDTAVNVTLKVDGPAGNSSGSAPTKIRFLVSLLNPNGERFVVVQEQALIGNHLNNRTQDETYTITIEDPKVTTNTLVETVTVINVDDNLNESQSDMLQANFNINKDKVSRVPTNVQLITSSGPDNANIEFDIPTQTIDGTSFTFAADPLVTDSSKNYPNARPNVIVEAFTDSGKLFTTFYKDTDVGLVNPTRGIVNFDFKQFGNFTQTETVYFTVRTAPPMGAFSARSNTASGSYLVAMLERSAVEPDGSRHLRRTAFSLTGVNSPGIETSVGVGVAIGFVSRKEQKHYALELLREIQEEINVLLELEGGISNITKQQFLEIFAPLARNSKLYKRLKTGDQEKDLALLTEMMRILVAALNLNLDAKTIANNDLIEITSSPAIQLFEISL